MYALVDFADAKCQPDWPGGDTSFKRQATANTTAGATLVVFPLQRPALGLI